VKAIANNKHFTWKPQKEKTTREGENSHTVTSEMLYLSVTLPNLRQKTPWHVPNHNLNIEVLYVGHASNIQALQ